MALSVPSHQIVINKIYLLANHKVMLDSDLAELYGVATKVLNQAVKRNQERFPEDFMFQLSGKDWNFLRSQFVTSNTKRGGRTYLPNVFTEHGILMLSSVLKGTMAVQVNIQIMRTFVKLRSSKNEKTGVGQEINSIKDRLESHDKKIELVFSYLDELNEKKTQPRKRIGFRPDDL